MRSFPYIEYPVVRHCNLNCKGCVNFSNISQESYASPTSFQADLLLLKDLYKDVTLIKLTGGEPLLHPDLLSFISISRKVFPRSFLSLITNGLLLPSQSEEFWSCCKSNRVNIIWSRYPIADRPLSSISQVLKSMGLPYSIRLMNKFYDFIEVPPIHSKYKSFKMCRKLCGYSLLLTSGSLYFCSRHAFTPIYNSTFNVSLPIIPGIKLSEVHNPRYVLGEIERPIDLCKYCNFSVDKLYSWSL